MKKISILIITFALLHATLAQEDKPAEEPAKDDAAAPKVKTRPAKAGEGTRALELWEKHCSNKREGGMDGAFTIKCTHDVMPATDGENELVNNNGTLLGKITIMETYPLEIVFVQPPTPNDTDSSGEDGGEDGGPKKEIIVLVQPGKNGTGGGNGADEDKEDAPAPEEIKNKSPEFVLVPSAPSGGGGNDSATTTTTTTPAPSRDGRDFWAKFLQSGGDSEEDKDKAQDEAQQPEELQQQQQQPGSNRQGRNQGGHGGGSDDPNHVVLPHQSSTSVSGPAPATGSLAFLRSPSSSSGNRKASSGGNKNKPSVAVTEPRS